MQRARSYWRKPFRQQRRFEETLQDAAEALAKDPKCSNAAYWKGIALFYMGDFAAAKAAFEASQQTAVNSQAPRALWLRKCDAELGGSTLPLIGVTAEITLACDFTSASPDAMALQQEPDSEGNHFVTCRDGTSIRCRLLLGGPAGDDRLDPKARTAICLHGIGEDLSFWEEGVFRTEELPENFSGFEASMPSTEGTGPVHPSDKVRRAKFSRALARRVNVLLVDQRGFGRSDRPRTLAPLQDENIVLLTTWKVRDVASFTTAAKAELNCARKAGAAAHSISLCGGKALVRSVFRDTGVLGMHMHALGSLAAELRLEACSTVESCTVVAPQGRLTELAYIQQTVLDKAEKLRKSRASFFNDLASPPKAFVCHRLHGGGVASLEEFVQEVRDNDGACIALSISVSPDGQDAMALGQFADLTGAVTYMQQLTSWVDSNGGEGAWQVVSVQIHARSAVLKTLATHTSLPKKLEVCQMYPLSFEDSDATDRTATMEDFVSDVEQVRLYAGASKATIVGHSMGAAIALQYAISHPHRVERLCLSAAAPRVGPAAYENWMRIASTYQAWNPNVIRSTVAVVNVADEAIRALAAPTLLINAKDDQLTPLIGSEMIKSNLQTALLHVPEFGGHSNLVKNDASMERLTHFMISDEAMMFLTDVLLEEQLLSKWNLPNDKAFVRYYNCGRGLAEIERLERSLRLLRWSSGDHQQEKAALGADMAKVLRNLGLPTDTDETPRDRLMAEMMSMLGRMSAPARQAIDNSGVWWRDDGAAMGLPDKRKYSVDAWGRRRGGCKQGNCFVYRWDLSVMPQLLQRGWLSAGQASSLGSDFFACWWCGGPPAAHEDLGPASKEELAAHWHLQEPEKEAGGAEQWKHIGYPLHYERILIPIEFSYTRTFG
eukprot:s4891_g11.t1